MELTNKTNTTGVGELASRLFHRKTTKVRFRVPMSVAQASNALLAAVQSEVAYRRRTFSMTDALSDQINRMATWLTGDSSKFAAVLCGGCGNGKTTLVKAFQNLLGYLNIPGSRFARESLLDAAVRCQRDCRHRADGLSGVSHADADSDACHR